ncbi:hypothetical protein L6452_31839 [Arctium lappa]|uniref:Uncharacterized protein n=1 Tax=Arctium lappa TaxID=4217 RepID=A0ACB8Z398_ARCLA|nr:hypothetical protein L6452_31839 [Arctium lappa]
MVKYRCRSLKRYGASIKEFHLGVSVDVNPYVERVLVVTQNLGNNWSRIYYENYDQLLGYQLMSPVLGLLAYNTEDDTKFRMQFEVKIKSPNANGITIDFSDYATKKKNDTSTGRMRMCATFGDDGNVTLEKEVTPNICATAGHGHFWLVMAMGENVISEIVSEKTAADTNVQGLETCGAVDLGLENGNKEGGVVGINGEGVSLKGGAVANAWYEAPQLWLMLI